MTANNTQTFTIEGHHDPEAFHDSSTGSAYSHPLYLVPLPPLTSQLNNDAAESSGDMLAFGGETDGAIYLVPSTNSNTEKPIAIREYDDGVRAVAVSPDGLRVAVGFDDGHTKIYSFDNFVPSSNGNNDGVVHHPFIPASALKKKSNEEEDDAAGFLSQSSRFSQGNEEEEEVMFEGPRFNAPIRQLAFDPRSSSKHSYYLAIVSECGTSPLVIATVDNEDSSNGKVLLGEEAEEEHLGGGVRSVAYCEGRKTNKDGKMEGKMLLATLGMDGQVVTWDVSSTMNDPSLEWEVCHKDSFPCVPKQDAGEGVADAGDRASKVVWGTLSNDDSVLGCLILPGKMDVQFRTCPLGGANQKEGLSTWECKNWLKKQQFVVVEEQEGGGHKDTIVSVAFQPRNGSNDGSKRKFVTGGRDGKLLLWEMTLAGGKDESALSGTFIAEVPMERNTSASGIPPITSLVWTTDNNDDVIHAANADGTISVVRSQGGKFAGVKDSKEVISKKSAAEKKASQDMEDEDGSGDDDDDDITVDLVTQPLDRDVEDMAPSKVSGLRRLAKNSATQNDDDDDDDALFDEDMLTSIKAKASEEKEVDAVQKSAEKDDSSSKKMDASKFIDDQAEDDDDEVEYDDADIGQNTVEKEASPQNEADARPMDGDNADFDDDAFDDHNDPLEFDHHDNHVTTFSLPPLQPAFAPSSTPVGDRRRILCWNHVGVVTLREDMDSENNLVDIAFHETAGLVGGRRPITFTDNMGFIVGTLGEEGGMFASDLMEEEDDYDDLDEVVAGLGVLSETSRAAAKQSRQKKNRGGGSSAKGSSVYFHRFETFGKVADKDWVVALPDGERVLGCATGSGWGAVITSRRYLRLFTTGGIQGPVTWIPGEPVTVVGRGHFVAVIYHRSISPMQDGTQLLGYSLFDGIRGTTIATGELSAISPGASLTWAGFTDVCALSVMDSDGMLSMLARPILSSGISSSMGDWVPMLDTVGLKKSTNDTYWPVEVHGGRLVCTLLRGGKQYPDAARRPVTMTLSLRIPLAAGLTVKSGPLEEVSIRGNIALNQKKVLNDYMAGEGEANVDDLEEEYIQMSAQVDKITLKLFMQVIQAGKVERGLDLVQRLHLEQSYDIAIQAADRVGHRKLSDRIEEAKFQKFPPSEEMFDDNASMESDFYETRCVDEEPEIMTRQQRLEMSQRISPEDVHTPQARRSRDNVEVERGQTTDEESPPRESMKRTFDEAATVSSNKRANPFAKKRMTSPSTPLMKAMASPSKLALSRQSTFSTKSRQKQRDGKQIV